MLKTNCGAMPMANMSSVTGTMMSFSLGNRSGNALQLFASEPLKSACIARANTMAVTSKPITAMAVNDAAIANEPLKIKNSPIKPFNPGKQSEDKMVTLIQQLNHGVLLIKPLK